LNIEQARPAEHRSDGEQGMSNKEQGMSNKEGKRDLVIQNNLINIGIFSLYGAYTFCLHCDKYV